MSTGPASIHDCLTAEQSVLFDHLTLMGCEGLLRHHPWPNMPQHAVAYTALLHRRDPMVVQLGPIAFPALLPQLHVWSVQHRYMRKAKDSREPRLKGAIRLDRCGFGQHTLMWWVVNSTREDACRRLSLACCFGTSDALNWLRMPSRRNPSNVRAVNVENVPLGLGTFVILNGSSAPGAAVHVRAYRSFVDGIPAGVVTEAMPLVGSYGAYRQLTEGEVQAFRDSAARAGAQARERLEREVALEYYERTEAYDRSVCTGPLHPRMGATPATAPQRAAIARHASFVRRELAARLGITVGDFRAILQQAPADADKHWTDWTVVETSLGNYTSTRRDRQ